jgi:hypothetical protein
MTVPELFKVKIRIWGRDIYNCRGQNTWRHFEHGRPRPRDNFSNLLRLLRFSSAWQRFLTETERSSWECFFGLNKCWDFLTVKAQAQKSLGHEASMSSLLHVYFTRFLSIFLIVEYCVINF